MTEEQKKKVEEQIQYVLDNNIVIEAEVREKIDSSFNSLNEFLEKNKDVKPTTNQEELDKLYKEYVDLMKVIFSSLKETKYKLNLTQDEFKFIKDVVLKKSKYGRTDVYLGMRAKEEFFEVESYPNGKDNHTFMVDIDVATVISYIVGKFEVEGLHKDATSYISVNEKFGLISRIFDMYNKKAEEIADRVQSWFQGLDANETEEVTVTKQEKVVE